VHATPLGARRLHFADFDSDENPMVANHRVAIQHDPSPTLHLAGTAVRNVLVVDATRLCASQGDMISIAHQNTTGQFGISHRRSAAPGTR
jgi:hypothetical protein